jgi:hypothetical protein
MKKVKGKRLEAEGKKMKSAKCKVKNGKLKKTGRCKETIKG